jgi:putative transposase
MAELLSRDERSISRKRVQRLMRTVGIAALGSKRRTSKPAPGHKVFSDLLRGLAIEWPARRDGCGRDAVLGQR